MEWQLIRPVHRHQVGNGDEAAISLRQGWLGPQLTKQYSVIEVRQLRGDIAKKLVSDIGKVSHGIPHVTMNS